MKRIILLVLLLFIVGCQPEEETTSKQNNKVKIKINLINENSSPISGLTMYVFNLTPGEPEKGLIVESENDGNKFEIDLIPGKTYQLDFHNDTGKIYGEEIVVSEDENNHEHTIMIE